MVKLEVKEPLPCALSWVVATLSVGSLCSITLVWLSGAGIGPKSLFDTFSFQVPLKLGFWASSEAANATASIAVSVALRNIHFPFQNLE